MSIHPSPQLGLPATDGVGQTRPCQRESSAPVALGTPASAPTRLLVLLAARNGRPWLDRQINSVLGQQGVQLDLLIADDASTDGSAEWLAARCAGHPRLRLQRRASPSGSAGASFVALLRDACLDGYDWIALADQDDVWHPAKLRRAVERLRSSGASAYSCAVRAFWADGRQCVLRQAPRPTPADFLFEGAGQGCTYVLEAQAARRVQSFCRQNVTGCATLHYHDWLIYLLLRSWRLGWHFDPQPWMDYRQHDGNEIGARGTWPAALRRVALIRSGWYRRQVLAACDLHAMAADDPSQADRWRMLLDRQRPPRWQRLRLAAALLSGSRRRRGDRVLLVVCALLGWL